MSVAGPSLYGEEEDLELEKEANFEEIIRQHVVTPQKPIVTSARRRTP